MKVKKATRKGSLILLLAVFFVSAALSAGCSKKEMKAKAEKIINVKVWTTEKKPVRPYMETIGNLKANAEVTISTEVDGILKSLQVDEGTPVSKGMPLAVINDTDYRLAVDTSEAAPQAGRGKPGQHQDGI